MSLHDDDLGIDRRDFVRGVAAMIAATYLPLSAIEATGITKAIEPAITKRFIITNAEWMRLHMDFSWAFRFVGHPEGKPSEQVYVATRVDDYILHKASRADKNKTILRMLKEMEKQIQAYLHTPGIQIVYDDKLKSAMRSKGVRL